VDWRSPLRKIVNREDRLGAVRLALLRIIDPVEWYMGKNDEERRRPRQSRRSRGGVGWTSYDPLGSASSARLPDAPPIEPARTPDQTSGRAAWGPYDPLSRRDAVRGEYEAYFVGKARDLLNGNDAVIETTAGHVRARLVRFRSGAVFEHWHSSRDGVGHGMSRIEREQLSDPAPLLVDLLVRDVVSLGPQAKPLR
jgi:hypothetical protein